MNPLHIFSPYVLLKGWAQLLILCWIATACSSSDEVQPDGYRHQKGEYIYRVHDESLFQIPLALAQSPDPYPWEKTQTGKNSKITKEFFRCKGSSLNPLRTVQEKSELVRYSDCGGAEKHSLPLRNNKEFIYPILIDLVNYIQTKTQKRVVITSGHRCPEHNSYADPSPSNRSSKHTLGAEVSFYVQGMENQPDTIIKFIQDYYSVTPLYKGQKEYQEFQRYDKEDSYVSTPPWYNKEIFIKLFKPKEGRNFDNRHPYPYVSIQVRYDEALKEKVTYSWDQAYHNYLRH